jgi:hypothetical protein
MSNRFRDDGRGNDLGGTAGATQFFNQMLTMPFSAFAYSMQLFIQMLQGASSRGGATNCGGAPCGGAPAAGQALNPGAQEGGWAAVAGGVGNTSQTTQKEDRKMSDQNWGNRGRDQRWSGGGGQGYGGQGWDSQQQGCGPGDQGWSVRDECRDAEPCDQLRLIRYKILFLKRDLEVAFPEQEELVAEDMPKDGFISWKIAEFIQAMSRGEVAQPGKWKEKGYPSSAAGGNVEDGNVTALPDKDKRFLRVYCQVLECYDRERMNYERDQIDILKGIKGELEKIAKKQ